MSDNKVETIENGYKKYQSSALSNSIFQIGLGGLLFVGGLWPGIMYVIGIAAGAALFYRGKKWLSLGSMVYFFSIPIIVTLFQNQELPWKIPWEAFGPIFMIGFGIVNLIQAFWPRS